MTVPFDAQLAASAFNGATVENHEFPLRYEVHRLGKLHLPTGAVVATDPFVFPDTSPFTRRVPAGRHRVDFAVAHLATGHNLIAFARLKFSESAPMSWEVASTPDDTPDSNGRVTCGYGVDSGTGCFMDANTATRFASKLKGSEWLEDRILNKIDAGRRTGRRGAIVRPAFWRFENIACFSSGKGDGTYVSSFGLDASGNPVQLITDFKVQNPSDRGSIELLKLEQQWRARAG